MPVYGATADNGMHLGNARLAVVVDEFVRLLRHACPHEAHTRRSIPGAGRQSEAPAANDPASPAAARDVDAYYDDLLALNILPSTHKPWGAEPLAPLIDAIQTLIAHGHAYRFQDYVLLDAASFPAYCHRSGRKMLFTKAEPRADAAPRRPAPQDSALWVPSAPGLPGWDSPWGRGRPAWYATCLAITVNGQKMSRPRCALPRIRDVLRLAPGEAIRLALMTTHYRHPLDWTDARLTQACRSLYRLYRTVDPAGAISHRQGARPDSAIVSALANGLNTPAALARLHQLANDVDHARSTDAKTTLKARLLASGKLLGLLHQSPSDMLAKLQGYFTSPVPDVIDTDWVNDMIAQRTRARALRNFYHADLLRRKLEDAGVTLQDSATGTSWWLGVEAVL